MLNKPGKTLSIYQDITISIYIYIYYIALYWFTFLVDLVCFYDMFDPQVFVTRTGRTAGRLLQIR